MLVRHEMRLLTRLGTGRIGIIIFRTLFGIPRQYLLAHISRKIDLVLIAGGEVNGTTYSSLNKYDGPNGIK